jgi:hypothetical protein
MQLVTSLQQLQEVLEAAAQPATPAARRQQQRLLQLTL